MNTCLVADDAPIICKVAKRIVRMHGFEADCAETPAALRMALIRRMPYLLVIADRLGDEDGLALVAEIRDMPGGKMPTILVCSAENGIALRTKLRRSSANGLLLKPFTQETFETHLTRLGLMKAEAA